MVTVLPNLLILLNNGILIVRRKKFWIKWFTSKLVSDLDINTYQSSLQIIQKKIKALENTTDVILVNLEDEDLKWTNGFEAKIVDLAE